MRNVIQTLALLSLSIVRSRSAPIGNPDLLVNPGTYNLDPQSALNLESLPNLDFEYVYYYAKQEMEARNYLESEINSEEI
ncbi:hypothetical protein K7432_015561 [Basidiobolus ranarum]|uniref:Uncharacterized protein n=1 Tax=Basidiobolus ranarum TaxID=34480 RepID=A0ABR2VMX1_9FUNG